MRHQVGQTAWILWLQPQSGQSCPWQQHLHSPFLPPLSPRIIFVDYSYKIPQAHVKKHIFINSSLLSKDIFIYFRTPFKVWTQPPQTRHSVVQCCPLQILKRHYSSLYKCVIFGTRENKQQLIFPLLVSAYSPSISPLHSFLAFLFSSDFMYTKQ